MTGLEDLAVQLDGIRVAQGLDRREVAARLGIHRAGVTRALNYNLTLPMAERLAAVLGHRIEVRLVPLAGYQGRPDEPEASS